MNGTKIVLKDIAVTVIILAVCFALCLAIHNVFDGVSVIPAVFILGAFLTSVLTHGYIYGIMSATVSVFAVNYAFTFPFFRFNFTITENIVSAVIMIIIASITCALTTKIKKQEAIKNESEKERMRANLLRAVSHDLRTPLTAIYGSASALIDSEDSFDQKQKRKMIEGICQEAQWLSRMVENLLSITRLGGGSVKIIKKPTALDELIDSVLLKFAKHYPDCEVDINIPDDFIIIPMDALLIQQVLINILENAVQHASGMTKLCLDVHIDGKKAVFEIKDDGAGIPKDKLANLFSGAGSAENNSSDSKKRNSGIGLSVCKTIISAHNGNIYAENAKDGGAVFCFTLDLEDE